MDCRTARLLVEFFRPTAADLGTEEADALQQHLAECSECARLVQAEHAWEDRVGAALRDVPVPPGLRERLAAGLSAERARRQRQRIRRVLGGSALAAALFLGIVLGWQWQRHHPPRLDLEQVAADFFGEIANPVAGNVEAFFQQSDRAFLAPRDFNYAHLKYYAWSDLQGKRVPLLLFVSERRDQARVYFLTHRQFNLSALEADSQSAGSGGCKVEVRLLPDRHAAHLVLYTGESLEPFLGRDDPRAALNAIGAAQ